MKIAQHNRIADLCSRSSWWAWLHYCHPFQSCPRGLSLGGGQASKGQRRMGECHATERQHKVQSRKSNFDFIYPQSFFVDCLNTFQLAHDNLLDILKFRQTCVKLLSMAVFFRCNGLLPLWGPGVAESAFANSMARHNAFLMEATRHRDVGYTSTLHDLKLLLLRSHKNTSVLLDFGIYQA